MAPPHLQEHLTSSSRTGNLRTGRFTARFVAYRATDEDRELGALIEATRPPSLREFDQIPMQASDLLRQVRAVAPLLAGRSVGFVGDSDMTSLALGLTAVRGGQRPASMLLLDFDRRLLARAQAFAEEHGFGHLLSIRAYNVFDALPQDLVGRLDWFYINPPYGSRNAGLSARLFVHRGMELIKARSGRGCAILPCDPDRPWTQTAWNGTEAFLHEQGWAVTEKIDGAHRYHLDDDPGLRSSAILVRRVRSTSTPPLPLAGMPVDMNLVEDFYGRAVKPPFPHYIREDGTSDLLWETAERRVA